MAITIKQSPDVLMPVYNDIVHTVDSTNKAQCSFRYICDIYVESVFVERLKLFPDPTTGYASFKINRILEDYISYDLHPNLYGTNIFSNNSNTCAKYVLKFGEEYDNSAQCDAGTTVYDNLTNTGNYYTFNAALQYEEWLSWSSTNYAMTALTSTFLTTMPNETLISLGSQLTMNFVNGSLADRMIVKTYDSTDTLLGTYTYTNNYSSFSSSADRIVTVGVGPENLNNSTLLSGSQPVIDGTVSYYTIQLTDSVNTALSEVKQFNINTKTYKYNTHRLWWLNRLGGFDSYDYNLKDKRRVETSKTFYNKLIGSYQSGSPTSNWTYDIGNRGKTVLSVNANQSSSYSSDFLTEDESIWMEGLFTTLEVYLSDTNVIDKFCSVVYYNDGRYKISIPVNQVYTTGQSVYIDFGLGNNFSYLTGSYTITYSNGTIIIDMGTTCVSVGSPPSCITEDTYTFDGLVYSLNFSSKLDPIIIKSTSYEEKIKYRIKNISYDIDVEPSYSINIQRN